MDIRNNGRFRLGPQRRGLRMMVDGLGGGAQTPLTWLLGLFRFGTPEAAPLTSPHTEADAVGSLALVQTDGQFSASANVANFPVQATATWGDQGGRVTDVAITRAFGRTVACAVAYSKLGGSGAAFGWFSAGLGVANMRAVLRNFASKFDVIWNGASAVGDVGVVVGGYEYGFAVTLRTTGAYFFVQAGPYGNWYPVFVTSVDTTTPVYAGMSNNDSAGYFDSLGSPDVLFSVPVAGYDSFTRADGALGSTETSGPDAQAVTARAWTDQLGTWGVASNVAAASALSGGAAIATFDSGLADVRVSVKMTRAGGSVGAVLRYADANNYLRMSHDGTNALLEQVVAGTPSTLRTGAVAFSAGAELECYVSGTTAYLFYNKANVGASFTVPASSATAHGLYTTNTGNTLNDVVVMAMGTGGEYNALSAYLPTPAGGVFAVGDSKTGAGADGFFNTWVPQLAHGLGGWAERPTRFGISGATTAQIKTYVDSNLAATVGTPGMIVINAGTNDALNGLPAEATWKGSLTGIIDALRAKWSGVPIYVARVWTRGKATECDTLATWIAAVVATYPSGVFVGMDERVWLENGDDGATYTSDGIHYTATAQPICVAAWLTAMGY